MLFVRRRGGGGLRCRTTQKRRRGGGNRRNENREGESGVLLPLPSCALLDMTPKSNPDDPGAAWRCRFRPRTNPCARLPRAAGASIRPQSLARSVRLRRGAAGRMEDPEHPHRLGPVFSRQCSWSGGTWMHVPGGLGVARPREVQNALALDHVDDLVVGVARAARRRPGGIIPTNWVTSGQPRSLSTSSRNSRFGVAGQRAAGRRSSR